MSGHHNLRIYTEDDNPWCKNCLNSERIVGDFVFAHGAYICFCDGVPTKDRCKGYIKRKNKRET